MRRWQIKQRAAVKAFRDAQWDDLRKLMIKQTAAYSTAKARPGRLWEGQALILHGHAGGPECVEDFGVLVKVGRFIIGHPACTARLQEEMPKHRRVTLARRVVSDASRLRQWMKEHSPAEPCWAPCCGQQGEHLARLLGLEIATVDGCAWACWRA
jgi:hypothetical protein